MLVIFMDKKILNCIDGAINLKGLVEEKLTDNGITIENTLNMALKIPGVKINRENFLRKELLKYCPKTKVQQAIDFNPAYAGISKNLIDISAREVISYETNKVSAISFVAGIPGATAMVATVPADIAQYFGFMLRVMQKLAYLYGFDEFELDENNINDDTMNKMLLFLGVMFGVQGANAGVKLLATSIAQRITKTLPNKALTKTLIYPAVKKVALKVGIKMNKTIFANSVAKIIPVIGGIVSGGITYAGFKPSAYRLKKSLEKLPLCDPNIKIKSE